jgi:AraC family transcriptional regulator of adaptative response / DNA-3-methyladenine glycosylase II
MTAYSAVVTTGIYCRPGCSAKPLARNVRVYEHPAAAEAAGFRACLRCRPYRIAGPVQPDAPALVCQVVQLIIRGALDDGGTEADLAQRVGLSARHLRRMFRRHLGATPDQVARSRRAHFARRLLDDTDLTFLDIAFASGFGSLRQFNRTVQDVFRASPTQLRDRRRRSDRLVADGGLALRLPVGPEYDWDAVRARLGREAIPGVESVTGRLYRRTIMVDDAPALLEVSPGSGVGGDHLVLRVHLPYWEGLIHLVGRVGLFLGTETEIFAPEGISSASAWNPMEAEVRSAREVSPQQAEQMVIRFGLPVPGLPSGLTHALPDDRSTT